MAGGSQDAVVIGAGPAGLAAAAMLRQHGVEPLVLERSSAVGSSWRTRYDRLLLNSTRRVSYLPGLRFPPGPRWPARDEVVEYLERYAKRHAVAPRFETFVDSVERAGGEWVLDSTDGPVRARAVIIATGPDHEPVVPPWPGVETFIGEVVHSSVYRNAEPFRGKNVVVVGSGESAGDVVMDLIEGGAARVWMSIRTPPYIFPASVVGIVQDTIGFAAGRVAPRLADIGAAALRRFAVGDLRALGLPAPAEGFFAAYRRRPVSAVIDRTGFVRAARARRFEVVARVERFEGSDLVLADGQRLRPDAVVAATGYRCGLESLVGHLEILDARGVPLAHAPHVHPGAPGLYLFGYTFALPNLRWLRVDSRRLGRAAAGFLRSG